MNEDDENSNSGFASLSLSVFLHECYCFFCLQSFKSYRKELNILSKLKFKNSSSWQEISSHNLKIIQK